MAILDKEGVVRLVFLDLKKSQQMVDNYVGIHLGSILGPLLFSVYINDLSEVCPPIVTCQMYADDMVMYLHAFG